MLYIKFFDNQEFDTPVKTSIFSYTPGDKIQYNKKGSLTAFIKISSESTIDSINLSKFIWNALLDEYRASDEDVVKSLNLALLRAQEQIKTLIEHDPNYIDKGVDAEIGLNVVLDDKVYFSIFGSPEVYILRDSKLIDVTSVIQKGRAKVINTLIQESDIYIFSEKVLSKIDIDESITQDTQKLLSVLDNPVELRRSSVSLISPTLNFDEMLLKQRNSSVAVATEISHEKVSESQNLNQIDRPQDVNHTKNDRQAEAEDAGRPGFSGDLDNSGAQAVRGLKAAGNVVDQSSAINTENLESISIASEMKIRNSQNIVPLKKGNGVSQDNLGSMENKTVADLVNRKLNNSPSLVKAKDFTKKAYNKAYNIFEKSLVTIKDKKEAYFPKIKQKVTSALNNKYGRRAWFKKYSSKLSQVKFATKSKEIKVGDYKVRELQTKRAFQLAIAAALILSIFFGVKTTQNIKARKEKAANEASIISQIENFVDRAQKQVKSDPATAETALFSARKVIDENKVDVSKLEDENKERYEEILGITQNLDDEINKRVPLAESENIDLFLDGRIAFGDSSIPTDLGLFVDKDGNESLVVTDQGEKVVYLIDIFTKKAIALPDTGRLINAPLYVDYGNNGIYVFDDHSGVVNFPLGEDGKTPGNARTMSGLTRNSFGAKVSELAILNVTDWVYVIDNSKGGLVRSTASESGSYSLPAVALSDPAIAQANDFFADLSIYFMGSGQNAIKRYNSGGGAGLAEAPFTIVGTRENIGDLVAGYTGASLNFDLYAFNAGTKSLLRFEKPIEGGGEVLHPGELLFLKQYVYRGGKKDVFDDIKDLVVDSGEKYTYILDGSKIWRVKN